MEKNRNQQKLAAEPVEEILGRYSLRNPAPELREKVLAIAEQNVRPLPRSEHVLRWALATLAVVVVWSSWMENETGERMARLAAASKKQPVRQIASHEDKVPEIEFSNPILARLLEPRVQLPLPAGYASTRRKFSSPTYFIANGERS